MATRAEVKRRNAKNKEFRKRAKVSSSAKKAAKTAQKAKVNKFKSGAMILKKGAVRKTIVNAVDKTLSPGAFSPARAAFDIGMMAKSARDADLKRQKKLLGKTGLKTI